MRIILIGFGNVGQGFVSIMADKQQLLKDQYGLHPRIVAVVTRSGGMLRHNDGLNIHDLTNGLQDYPWHPGLTGGAWDEQTIKDIDADVLIEASPTNLETGQPALNYCYAAIDSGKHVILANKGPVALAYADLIERARQAGVEVRFEGTVMAGTPSIRMAQEALAGCEIVEARGILNGTTNYILGQMEQGQSYDEALTAAQYFGYAEADPGGDVDGWDAAAKVLILGALLYGQRWTLDDLDVTGITNITIADVQEAQAAGERWKLIASVKAGGGSVAPIRLPVTDPLANVSGATNAITYSTDLLGDVTLIGAGAGRRETGFALLADLIALHKKTQT